MTILQLLIILACINAAVALYLARDYGKKKRIEEQADNIRRMMYTIGDLDRRLVEVLKQRDVGALDYSIIKDELVKMQLKWLAHYKGDQILRKLLDRIVDINVMIRNGTLIDTYGPGIAGKAPYYGLVLFFNKINRSWMWVSLDESINVPDRVLGDMVPHETIEKNRPSDKTAKNKS